MPKLEVERLLEMHPDRLVLKVRLSGLGLVKLRGAGCYFEPAPREERRGQSPSRRARRARLSRLAWSGLKPRAALLSVSRGAEELSYTSVGLSIDVCSLSIQHAFLPQSADHNISRAPLPPMALQPLEVARPTLTLSAPLPLQMRPAPLAPHSQPLHQSPLSLEPTRAPMSCERRSLHTRRPLEVDHLKLMIHKEDPNDH